MKCRFIQIKVCECLWCPMPSAKLDVFIIIKLQWQWLRLYYHEIILILVSRWVSNLDCCPGAAKLQQQRAMHDALQRVIWLKWHFAAISPVYRRQIGSNRHLGTINKNLYSVWKSIQRKIFFPFIWWSLDILMKF